MRPVYTGKIINLGALVAHREAARAQGQTVVLCHGCFDIVHPGHIRHLRFAAEQGDRLVVTLTADRFVNKGPGRPMFDERLRADNLAALSFVDWVVINDHPTAAELLEAIRPDIYVKGAEYAHNADPRFEQERSCVEATGGRVVFSSDDVVYSSSALIESLRVLRDPAMHSDGFVRLAQTHDLSTAAVARAFESARGKRVMVLSESIIDIYEHCHWPETAQEHPMLSLRPEREERFDGGGAIIASHLAAMGLGVTLCTPVGQDPESQSFAARMRHAGVDIHPLNTDRPIPRKVRYLVDHNKVMKIDSNTRYAFGPECADEIVSHITQSGGYDALVIADFGLGLFANTLASRVISAVRERVGMILGDVSGRRAQLGEMRGADVLCPCEVELRQMLDSEHEPLVLLAQRAMEITGVNTICVTRAGDGLEIFHRNSQPVILPALCVNPVDVLGCGDALLTAMTATLLGGGDHVQAGFIGSLAAAIEGESHGNIAVSSSQVIGRARQLAAQFIHEQVLVEQGLKAIGSIEPRIAAQGGLAQTSNKAP